MYTMYILPINFLYVSPLFEGSDAYGFAIIISV